MFFVFSEHSARTKNAPTKLGAIPAAANPCLPTLIMAKGFSQDKQWNWHNFRVCLAVGFIGQLAFGYPSSIIGVTLAQPAFLEYMGLLTLIDGKPGLSANANALIGATSGVFQAGAFFGVLIGSWVMDKYGKFFSKNVSVWLCYKHRLLAIPMHVLKSL